MNLDDILKGNIPKKYIDTIKYIIKFIIVLLIFHYSYILQYIPIKLLNLDTKSYNETLAVIISCFGNFLLMFIFYFIYRKDIKKEWKKFKENFWDNLNIGFYAWFVGLVIMFVSNIIISFVLKGGGAQNEQAVQGMIKTIPILMVINAGFVAPFNEEIVFRKTLKDIFKNMYLFMLASFLLFGGAHVIGNTKSLIDWLYIIPYGSLGAAFAYAYYKTDTIFTSMSLHMFHNLVLCVMSIVLLLI